MARQMPFGQDDKVAQIDGLRLAIRSYPANQERQSHTHDNLSFFLPLAGGMVERHGSHRHEITNLMLVAQTNQVEHNSVVSNAGMRGLFLEPAARWLERHQISVPTDSAYQIVDDPRTLDAIALATELSSDSPDEMLMEEKVLELCSTKAADRDLNERPLWLNKVQDLMREQYWRPLSLGALADLAGVHPVHLARVFRRHHRRSISGYLRAIRVEEGLRKSRRMPLGEAAVECGFADQSHFCRSVKRELRRTPGQVMTALKGEQVLQSFYS